MSVNDDIKRIMITEDEIGVRSRELARQISDDYGADAKPLVVALLKGSVPFFSQLIKNFELDLEVDFMDVSSYAGTRSTGEIRILKDLESSVVDRDVLIVEDIIDTGRTINSVKKLLESRHAKSVKVVALLDKPSRRIFDINADYVGFEIEDEFVVGYGLDFNQHYRHLPYIGILKDDRYR